jgi:hypothetical protein
MTSSSPFSSRNTSMTPTQEDIEKVFIEATFNAGQLINKLLEKQTLSSEEKNAAEIALRFLEMSARSPRT